MKRLPEQLVDRSRVEQSEARVLRERDEQLLLRLRIDAAGDVRGDDEAADHSAVVVDRRRDRRLEPSLDEFGQRVRHGCVVVDDDEAILGDRHASDALADETVLGLAQELGLHTARGDRAHPVRILGLDQPQADDLVAEQLTRPLRDQIEHLLERRAHGDRALDRGAPLEQPLTRSQRLDGPDHRQRHPEDARHAAKHDHFLGPERIRARAGEDDPAELRIFERDGNGFGDGAAWKLELRAPAVRGLEQLPHRNLARREADRGDDRTRRERTPRSRSRAPPLRARRPRGRRCPRRRRG